MNQEEGQHQNQQSL